jgi:hypothetical protein
VRQTDRDPRVAGEVLDLPVALGLEQQRLGRDAGLAREPGVRLRARCVTPSTALTALSFGVKEESRELDVGVAETVDDGDAVALEDLACFRRRRARDEQEIAVGRGLGLLHDLPRGGGVGTSFDRDGDRLGGRAEPEHGIASTAAPSDTTHFDCDAGDLT